MVVANGIKLLMIIPNITLFYLSKLKKSQLMITTFMSEMSTDPCSVTRSGQLMMTPNVELSKYSINILHVVKFIYSKNAVL